MSSSLLLQQCPACLVRRTCIVFVMGGKCPYSWSLDTIIKTDAGRLLYKNIYLSLYLQGFEKVVWGSTVRGS